MYRGAARYLGWRMVVGIGHLLWPHVNPLLERNERRVHVLEILVCPAVALGPGSLPAIRPARLPAPGCGTVPKHSGAVPRFRRRRERRALRLAQVQVARPIPLDADGDHELRQERRRTAICRVCTAGCLLFTAAAGVED